MTRKLSAKPKIEEAALRLFASEGVSGASMRRIAAEAGITEPAVYRHFANKEELVARVFEERYRQFGQELADVAAGADEAEFRSRLAAMVRAACRIHDRDPGVFRFLLTSQHDSLPRMIPGFTPVDVVAREIEEAVSEGECPAQDPNVATAIVFGIVLQTATFLSYGRVSGSMEDHAARLSKACVAALESV